MSFQLTYREPLITVSLCVLDNKTLFYEWTRLDTWQGREQKWSMNFKPEIEEWILKDPNNLDGTSLFVCYCKISLKAFYFSKKLIPFSVLDNFEIIMLGVPKVN